MRRLRKGKTRARGLTSDNIPKLNSATTLAFKHFAKESSSPFVVLVLVAFKAASDSCNDRKDHVLERVMFDEVGGFRREDDREFMS